tara:strand:+ start:121 stop:621 length:501 start_codon:yes stop_codon:yes gene_type:complete
MNLEKLSNNLEIKYYKNIINYCKKTNNSKKNVFEKKLKSLTSSEIKIISETESVNSVNKNVDKEINEEKNNSSESKEIVYSDDYLYKKNWTKLSNVHKIIKLKEFVSQLLIDKIEDKEKLKEELTNLIKNKYLTKKDKVKYDEVKGKVIAIPVLSYKNGKYYIKKQ